MLLLSAGRSSVAGAADEPAPGAVEGRCCRAGTSWAPHAIIPPGKKNSSSQGQVTAGTRPPARKLRGEFRALGQESGRRGPGQEREARQKEMYWVGLSGCCGPPRASVPLPPPAGPAVGAGCSAASVGVRGSEGRPG